MLIGALHKAWQELKDAIEKRRNNLLRNERAQQYLFDANEAESWMSEQELYMMVEDRGKDETSARNLMKKHESLEAAVESYAETIRSLGETVRALAAEGHPLAEQVCFHSINTPNIKPLVYNLQSKVCVEKIYFKIFPHKLSVKKRRLERYF